MHDKPILNKIKTIRSRLEWIGYHFLDCMQAEILIFNWKAKKNLFFYSIHPEEWETHKYVHMCSWNAEYSNQNQSRTSSISDHERNAVLSSENGSLVCVQP